jgi:hypothetical protein
MPNNGFEKISFMGRFPPMIKQLRNQNHCPATHCETSQKGNNQDYQQLPPYAFKQVKLFYDPDPRGYKEEGHVCQKEICRFVDMMFFQNPCEQENKNQDHTDNTARERKRKDGRYPIP